MPLDIKALRATKRLTQDQLADLIKVSRGTIINWEKGKTSPDEPELLALSKVFNIKEAVHADKSIPLYDIVAVGGREGIANLDPTAHPSERIYPGDWFSDATGAIRIYGESMFPKYPNGSVVTFKEVKDWELLLWGQVYVIETSEYRVIKRLQKGEAKGAVRADSDNTMKNGNGREVHESFEIPLAKIKRLFLVLGKVERLQA